MSGHEGQDTRFPVHSQILRVRHDLDGVDVPACEAIDRVEDLKWSDEIELIDWRNDDHDNSPACRMTSQTGLLIVCRVHAPSHYAAALQAKQAKPARWPRETDLCRESCVFLRYDAVAFGEEIL